ncbi:hypothetical protein ACET3Z_030524 [Daucus carota]
MNPPPRRSGFPLFEFEEIRLKAVEAIWVTFLHHQMRLKRQRRHGRTLTFLAACFGFRDPFKVLCDGAFIHHLAAHDINPVHMLFLIFLALNFSFLLLDVFLRNLVIFVMLIVILLLQLVILRCDHVTVIRERVQWIALRKLLVKTMQITSFCYTGCRYT